MTSTATSSTPVSSSSSQINTSPNVSTASSIPSSCERDVVNGTPFCSSVTNSQLPSLNDVSASIEAVASATGLSSSVTSFSTRMSNVLLNQVSSSVLSTPDISSSWSTIKNTKTPLSASSSASSPSSSLSLAGATSSAALGGGPPLSSGQLLLNGIVAGCVNNLNNQHQMLTEDPRALQLALELSMVGLNEAAVSCTTSTLIPTAATQTNVIQLHNFPHMLQQQSQHHYHRQQQLQQHNTSLTTQQQQHQQQYGINTLNSVSAVVAAAETVNNVHHNIITTSNGINNIASSSAHSLNQQLNQFPVSSASGLLPTIEDRSKKSQNMTECVPVPSSEHVAEIVGRQGCKIKALRAKTNTYIKTPVRGEEPVFVVTGRKEDVAKAKREILSAAEHFSLIRATRKPSFDDSILNGNNVNGGSGKTPPGPPSIPGQMTIQVRVPYRVVGLVVGPKGATIKHIQQETHTYIVTPSREKEPIFEVTGLPENVQSARKQIEAHIALRTGNSPAGGRGTGGVPTNSSDVSSVHTINTLSQILNDADPELLASLYKNGICSAFDYIENNGSITATGGVASVLPNSASMSLNLATSVGINATTNQMLMNSLPNCNNFQIQNINGTPANIDYINNRMNNCNVNTAVVDTAGSGINNSCSLSHLHHHVHTSAAAHRHVSNISATTASYNNNINSTINAINMNGGSGVNIAGNTSTASTMQIARSYSSASSTTSSKSANNSGGSSSNSSRPELMNIWKNLGDSLDVDEGIGESPSIWTLPTPLAVLAGSHCSPSTSISPTDSLLCEINAPGNSGGSNILINQQQRESVTTINTSSAGINTKKMLMQQLTISGNQLNHNMITSSPGMRRECLVCSDKEVTAVLVPCGHNMFCMECANRICSSGDATCPVCSLTVYHAMRILA